ncbi:hypothetical protein JCM10213_005830 [Rhodosporidiobolus nylandii]
MSSTRRPAGLPAAAPSNITRLEEWCKAHDMPEGTLQLEHLMQATKLLQLKKASLADIEIIFDVCWMLTPTQIQKLVANCAHRSVHLTRRVN